MSAATARPGTPNILISPPPLVNYELSIINYEWGIGWLLRGGCRNPPTKSPPFAKGGLGGFTPDAANAQRRPHCARPHTTIPAAPTVIPAQAGIQNPGYPRRSDRAGCGFPLSRE